MENAAAIAPYTYLNVRLYNFFSGYKISDFSDSKKNDNIPHPVGQFEKNILPIINLLFIKYITIRMLISQTLSVSDMGNVYTQLC
jgi:hypothetical protein